MSDAPSVIAIGPVDDALVVAWMRALGAVEADFERVTHAAPAAHDDPLHWDVWCEREGRWVSRDYADRWGY